MTQFVQSAGPDRIGSRPKTTPSNPHIQLDQQPTDDRARQHLLDLLAGLPVIWKPSAISVPGALALTLEPNSALGPKAAFMIGTEFAHLHPAPDYSLHLILPPARAEEVISAGWAEQHPIARLGYISSGAVMVYAPRDDNEVELVAEFVRESCAYAIGVKSPH
ncbi:MAG: luciferase family protein [Candidatus Nanopelagicaceae bacterium]